LRRIVFNMGTNAVQRDATAETVSANVKRLRDKQHLGLRGLSKKLGDVGRPLGHSAVDQIEKGTRRVDVDDLVALAVALQVSPVTLLMPDAADEVDPVRLTGLGEPAAAIGVWEWLRGRAILPGLTQMSVDTWPSWEQQQVLGRFTGRADGND
jgi:transcriptional regulator with XRE-family HTH domain